MRVKLIAKTTICDEDLIKELQGNNTPESLIMFTARVSSPNQTSNNPGLLRYCMKHKHWSIYEQADFTFEIITSRGVAAQLLRHKSFHFQEFSQRYSSVNNFEVYEARRQDVKNRQNSIADMSREDNAWFKQAQETIQDLSVNLYEQALEKGIAKEQARFLLPLSTETKLYMKGTVRDWIHYVNTRTEPSTQKEHRDIAESIKLILIKELPVIAEAASWNSINQEKETI
jgi:thymidylate synthase (FAD)